MEYSRAQEQLRAEEFRAEDLEEEMKFQEEERVKKRVKRDLQAEDQRRAEKECLTEIAEWLQKRKQLREKWEQDEKQLTWTYYRAELRKEMTVNREFEGFDGIYSISFTTRSRPRQQPIERHETEHKLTEYFDYTEFDMEDSSITVSRRLVCSVPYISNYAARPRLSQRAQTENTPKPNGKAPSSCIIM